MSDRPRLVAVVGPTASGKSDLAVAVASRVNGEVINADSMQLYRGMDIGTAKLTIEQRRGVAHHLLDVWPVTRTATVAEFQALANECVSAITDRGHVPLLVGGSGLYVHAVIDEWRFPGTDEALRAELENELERRGAAALHEQLAERDPAAAAHILPTNGRRIVRALEVVRLKGSFTSQLPPPGAHSADSVVLLGLDVPRADLDRRIEARVEHMWGAGLVAEVQLLERDGLREGRTASRALGYAQVLRFLAGELSEDEARALTVSATRRFARKQDAWFRRDSRIHWLPSDAPTLLADALELVDGAGPVGLAQGS